MQHAWARGKRQGGTPLIAAVPLTNNNSDLLYARDPLNKRNWLMDGGAFVSLVPPSFSQRTKGANGKKLTAANGTSIDCYGEVNLKIQLGSRIFDHTVVVADVRTSLLGADFFANHALAPNHRDRTLIDISNSPLISTLDAQTSSLPHYEVVENKRGGFKTGFSANPKPNNHINHINPSADPNDSYTELLQRFPDLTTPNFKLTEVDHGVSHHIPTTGHPIKSKARRLAPEKLAQVKAELEKYVELGVARRSKSEWSSPLLTVTKPDGSLRVCGDYRRLNCQTENDNYPVKNIGDFNSELDGKTIFSKVDLLKGYHQIPVNPEDIRKTAVVTPFGLYEFPRTPFGLKTAAQSFQRLMDEILADIPHVFVYLDDVLVASATPAEHLRDLERLFKRLQENGLVINAKKCVFGQSTIDFLGYRIDAEGIHPMEERVSAIREQTPPTSIKELQRFLGMINYYRRFIPKAAHHLYPLFEALRSKTKKFEWTAACQAAFEAVKTALSAATLLHHPRRGAHLAITTDASKVALGAVLEQRGPQGWEPLSYFSMKLSAESPNQQAWPPFDRELLGVFRAVRHFRHMVEGRPFTIYTDQQALVPALHKKAEPLTQRQTYQLSCVAEMTTDIRYIQGKANFVADALSRPNGCDVSSIQQHERHIFAILMQQHCLPDVALIAALNPSHSSDPAAQCLDDLPPAHTLPIESPLADLFSERQDDSQPERSKPQQDNVTLIGPIPAAALPASTTISEPTAKLAENTPISHINRPLDPNKSHELDALVGTINNYGINLAEMAADQFLDADFRRISNDPQSGLSLRKVDVGNRDLLIDVSNGSPRPFVPFGWRRRIFDAVHGLGHPGVHRTQQTLAERFVWPSIKADAAKWARECIPCQQAKINRHVTPPISNFEVPARRFSHLNLDIVTLPSSNGFNHLLTIVDRLTRWPVAIPISDITAETVADAFALGWVATYGIPVAITTDRGSQFSSSIWTQLMNQWGIKPLMTAAYHPEANGLVERMHRRLKEAILALCPDSPNQWFWKLPLALLAIRTTLKPDIGASPADMVFGEGLALPGDLIQSADPVDDQFARRQAATLANLRVEVARLQPTPTSAHRTPRVFMPQSLETATHVFVRRGGVQPSLQTPYEGPYRVSSRTATGFHVRLPGGRTELITLNRLKPAFVSRDQRDGEDPQDLDDEQPPSPNPPGRRPGPRTRQPAATTRQTRSATRQQSARQPDGEMSSTSQPPSTSTKAPRRKQSARNIDEFNVPTAPTPASPQQSTSGGFPQDNPSVLEETTVPATSTAPSVPSRSTSGSDPADDLFAGDTEPRLETNFFAPLERPTTSEAAGERRVGDQLVGDPHVGERQPGDLQPRLTSSLRTNRPPSGARVRFSDQRHRDPQQSRTYFSDPRRPRPDLSMITASILSHLSST